MFFAFFDALTGDDHYQGPFLGEIIENLLTAEAIEKHLAEEQDNAPGAAMLNQITAVAREDKVCLDLTADEDA